MKKPSFLKSPFTTGLKTACSVLALTACLVAGGVQAADQGPRHHARGQYDTVTATYVAVEGDELIAIGERFEVPVDVLKAQNKLPSDEIEVGQKLVVAASASSLKGQVLGARLLRQRTCRRQPGQRLDHQQAGQLRTGPLEAVGNGGGLQDQF